MKNISEKPKYIYDKEAVTEFIKNLFKRQNKAEYKDDLLAIAFGVGRSQANKIRNGKQPWTRTYVHKLFEYLKFPKDTPEKQHFLKLVGLIHKLDDNNISNFINQTCYLPTFERQYYYELQLAEPAPRRRADDKKDKHIPHEIRHLSENINSKTNSWHKPESASQRFRAIANNHSDAVHIILGEPGGGKTTLLSKWAHDAYAAYQKDVAQPFPIYMRLRELGNPDDKNAALAAYYKRLTSDTINVQPFLAKEAKALWLFDGWDELAEEARQSWVSYINTLAGQKIVSCRVLRYQNDFGATAKRYLIYGLNREQQKEYLQKIVPQLQEVSQPHHNADEAWVDELLRKLHSQEHSRLRQLAISPLLLKLIADTNPPNNIKLPNTRTQFYDDAISAMLKREQRLGSIGRLSERNLKKALAEIAHHAGLNFNFSAHVLTDGLEAICGEDEAKAQKLEENLMNCGILRSVGNSYEFLHATFQEWALAHHLAQQENPLVNAVQAYWRDPSYDEVIALLWMHEAVDEAQREAATLFLMDAGCQEQAGNVLSQRSGLKQSVFFWDAAGIQMPDKIAQRIWTKVEDKPKLQLAFAKTNFSQIFLLKKLANIGDNNTNYYIRSEIALNPNIPVDIMYKFANDNIALVRLKLASNPNIYLAEGVIEQLAENAHYDVLTNLAGNETISDEVALKLSSVSLAEGDTTELISALLSNPSISEKIKEYIIDDNHWHENNYIFSQSSDSLGLFHPNSYLSLESFNRAEEIVNANILSEESMVILAADDDKLVRATLAFHSNLTPKIIDLLVQDEDESVRVWLAINPNISENTMLRLAKDSEESVRFNLASNPNISTKVVDTLMKDNSNEHIHWKLAENPNVCWEVFLRDCLKTQNSFVNYFQNHLKILEDSDSCLKRVVFFTAFRWFCCFMRK